jgi:thiamine biosynthesis protein ThiS
MQINFNGAKTEIDNNLNISQLVKKLNLDIDAIAIEHNLTIVSRSDYDNVVLQEGDNIEVVEFVGGG